MGERDDIYEFDLDTYLQIGEMEDAGEFFEMIQIQINNNMESLFHAVHDENPSALASSANSLGTVLSYFGAVNIREVLLRLEQLGEQHNVVDSVDIVEQLPQMLESFVEQGKSILS